MLHIACPGSVKTMIAVIITSARCESMLDPTANPAYSVLMDWATLPTTADAARPQVSPGEYVGSFRPLARTTVLHLDVKFPRVAKVEKEYQGLALF